MLFGKLLPREGNFFELFNDHGNKIVEGAQAFMAMVQNYADPSLREKYAAGAVWAPENRCRPGLVNR